MTWPEEGRVRLADLGGYARWAVAYGFAEISASIAATSFGCVM